METFSFDKNFSRAITGNLLHNRINAKWKPDNYFTVAAELRNRVFWGDQVAATPGFSRLLRNENEWMNMSALWVSRNNFIIQSNVERLWLEYRKTNWNVRIGRQRINWGITTTWNPNDIFNAYNFLDFDYEERPGTDAVKFHYDFRDFSNIEIAVSPMGNRDKAIAAARYFFNRWGYDFQFLAGVYQNKFTTGFGWAGSIGNIGYKGEGQAFIDRKDSADYFNYSLELSYVFKKGWYVSGSVLHNTSGISKPVEDWTKVSFRISPMNLMPAKWSIVVAGSKEFTPLFSGSLNLVYSPGVNLGILYPSLKYNIAQNVDIDMVWQSFFLELKDRLQAVNHQLYLRVKWSF